MGMTVSFMLFFLHGSVGDFYLNMLNIAASRPRITRRERDPRIWGERTKFGIVRKHIYGEHVLWGLPIFSASPFSSKMEHNYGNPGIHREVDRIRDAELHGEEGRHTANRDTWTFHERVNRIKESKAKNRSEYNKIVKEEIDKDLERQGIAEEGEDTEEEGEISEDSEVSVEPHERKDFWEERSNAENFCKLIDTAQVWQRHRETAVPLTLLNPQYVTGSTYGNLTFSNWECQFSPSDDTYFFSRYLFFFTKASGYPLAGASLAGSSEEPSKKTKSNRSPVRGSRSE